MENVVGGDDGAALWMGEPYKRSGHLDEQGDSQRVDELGTNKRQDNKLQDSTQDSTIGWS